MQESVSIEVIHKQSTNSKLDERLNLAVRILNANKVYNTVLTEVSLLSVALLSSFWILLNDMRAPEEFTIYTQENVGALVKARRKVQKKAQYSEIPFRTGDQLSGETSHAYLDFVERSIEKRINVFEETEEGMEQQCELPEVVLVVKWQALVVDGGSKRYAYGQSQLSLGPFSEEYVRKDDNKPTYYQEIKFYEPDTNNDKEKVALAKLQKQVIYNLTHPSVLYHNFEHSKVCTANVKLFLHSIVGDDTLTVTINTLSSSR